MNQLRKYKNFIPGGVITGIVLAAVLVFDWLLIRCGLVPLRLIAPAAVLLLALTAVVWAATRRITRKVRFALGTVLALLMCAVLIYGSTALVRVTRTLNSITTIRTDAANVGVYVLAEDDAETVNELAGEVFGIMAEIDQSSTEGAIAQFEQELETDLTTVEYEGLVEVVDALLDGECRAIVLNSAFLEVLEEVSGYTDIMDRIREVTLVSVVSETEVTTARESVEITTVEDAISILTQEEESVWLTSSEDVFTVYISGIDSRSGLVARSRSDTNILAMVNTATHQVLLLSTPRDYYVPLSISGGAKDKLTHAGIYGVSVSMETLEMLYEVDVDYYIRVSFEGLEEVVDALGGVNVYSAYSFQSSVIGSKYFYKGYNYMNGKEALAFARERYAFASGDRQRGKNQLELIKAIIDKALSPEILVNYASLLTAAENSLDSSVPYDLIASLVSDQLSSGADWEIISYSVDGTGSYEKTYSLSASSYVMIPDESTVDTAKNLMQAMLRGEVIEQP